MKNLSYKKGKKGERKAGNCTSTRMASRDDPDLDLLKLNQYTAAVFWMNKDDRLTVGANLGLLTEQPDAFALEISNGGVNVVHLKAEMMNATRGIL